MAYNSYEKTEEAKKSSFQSSLEAKAQKLANGDDEETKTQKFIKEVPRWHYFTLVVLALSFTAFQLYIKLIMPLDSWIQVPLHLGFAMALSILFNPLAVKYKKKALWLIDGALLAGVIFIVHYYISNDSFFNMRVFSVDPMRPVDMVAGIMLTVMLIEVTRRCVSGVLVAFMLIIIAYGLGGKYVPGIFRFAGLSIKQMVETLSLGTNGILGSPLATSVGTLFYFMIFGAFFSHTGGGAVLIDWGMKMSDKTAGGPAKAAVISSGLMGMVSGSAVANVSTTGVLTIPLMKKSGYTPEEAGAVESVASTGGQIMPPIMGVGAFIMAEMIGVNYTTIATSAIIPALCYFGAVFMVVDLLARKKKMSGGNKALKYEGKPILPRVYRLLPIMVLVIMIFLGFSLPRTAIYCTLLSIAIGQISKDTRLNLHQLLNCLIEGCRQAAYTALPTGACGIMIGIVVRSGAAVKIAKLITSSGNSSLFLALLVAAAGCILLGMALPTSAAYLLGNVLFVSAIQSLNIGALSANMFLFYFGVIAQITPPVCVASYTAAGIAGASAWKTGWKAFTFAITAFLVPFLFVYQPAILLQGTVLEIIYALIVVFSGTMLLAMGVAGYFRKPLQSWERAVCFVASILLIMPSQITDIIGILVALVFMVYCSMTKKRASNQNSISV